jgi:hypothetical protein
VDKHVFTKKSCSDYGNTIISHEINFYKTISSELFPNVIELGKNYLRLEYLSDCRPLKEFDFKTVSEKVFQSIKKLHSIHPPVVLTLEEFKRNLRLETFEKIQTRTSKIVSDIPVCTHVNGVPLMSLENILKKLQEFVETYSGDTAFYVIHGDLNFGNILFDGSVRFIDPRGYFGTSRVFGPREYDFAKVYFSLSGYDAMYDSVTPLLTIREGLGTTKLPVIPEGLDDLTHVLCISIWLSASLYFDGTEKLASCYYWALYLATLRFGTQSTHVVREGD